MDVSSDWVTKDVLNVLKENNILLEIIRNGCLHWGTADAIKIGSTLLPSLDYFQGINYYVQIRKLV